MLTIAKAAVKYQHPGVQKEVRVVLRSFRGILDFPYNLGVINYN